MLPGYSVARKSCRVFAEFESLLRQSIERSVSSVLKDISFRDQNIDLVSQLGSGRVDDGIGD